MKVNICRQLLPANTDMVVVFKIWSLLYSRQWDTESTPWDLHHNYIL
jgi:hypothetical protein